MARYNAEVQPSPVPGPEDVHPKDSEASENSDDDEATARTLNSASAKKKTMDVKSGGFFGGLSRWIPTRSAQPTERSGPDQTTEEDVDKPPNLGDIMDAEPAAEDKASDLPAVLLPEANGLYPTLPEESMSETFPIVSSTSRNGPKRKPKPRDTYEISDHEEVVETDKEIERPAKRIRPGPKAKRPLGAAKQSNGKPLPIPNNQGSESLKPRAQTIIDPPASTKSDKPISDANAASNEVTPVKRKPGRPKKARSSAPDTIDGNVLPPQTAPNTLHASGSVVAGSAEGVSSFLMDPSPVKVTHPSARAESSRAGKTAESDSEFPDLAHIRSYPGRKDTPEESIKASEAPFHFDNSIVDFDRLERMLEKANYVGHTYLKKEKRWELKRRVKLYTNYGKRLNRQLGELTSLYTELRSLNAENDQGDMLSKYTAITSLLDNIKEETKNILSLRLGNPALRIAFFDAQPTRTLLVDLYFNIFPKLLECIKLGAEAYYENDTIETPLLEELADLVECLYSLAETAIIQPKTMQPKPQDIHPKNADYFHISRPTQRVLPLLREFRGIMKDELIARAEVENRDRRERVALKRESERREVDHLEMKKKRQEKKAILRRQREDLNRQLADPYWGKFLREDIERYNAAAEAKEAAKEAMETLKLERARKSRAHEFETTEEDEAEDRRKRWARIGRQNRAEITYSEGDDALQDDISETRVSGVFGTNNKQQNGSQPWSDERRAEFLQFLWAHDEEEDRFEHLAKKFQCTMDEVFDYAKDLQEAMDDAHEKGKLSGPEDDWTYRVWEEVYEGSRGR